jgi:hypothetical protein
VVKFLNIEAFLKLQFWESNLEIRGFARLKARKTARACPKTLRVSAQSISLGTGSIVLAGTIIEGICWG